MVLVTKKDGTPIALNVDRIERVEANQLSGGRESNVYFVGGEHLVVEEPLEGLLDQILDAKAHVAARASLLATLERAGFLAHPDLHLLTRAPERQ